jgi:N4-gp56 family major capsid protein
MAINLATKYASKVDERFKQKELTGYGLNTDYNWEGVDTINVYSIDVSPLNDYQKSGTSRYGTPEELGDTTASYKLTTDKSFTFTIDEFYKKSQMGAKQAGKALAREIDEVIVPFKDKQRLAKWAETAGATGQEVSGTPSKTNAYSLFLDMQEKLDNELVPTEGRIFYTNPAYYKVIKQDDTFIKSGDMSQKMLINGQVGEIDGVKIVKCPASYFPEGVAGILVYTKSTLSPSKLKDYKIHNDPVGINGDLVEGRIMMDTFVLEQKKKGIVALKTA